MPAKEVVVKNEIVKVKGRVKAITVPKEKTQEVLKRKELRILDKKYEVLMPPLDDMEKNTIDAQGFSQILSEFLTYMLLGASSGQYNPPTYAEIIIYTNSNSQVTLQYASEMSSNSQGVVVLNQFFGSNNLMNIQYYFIGFDTTSNSYQGSSLELYVAGAIEAKNVAFGYTNLIRIAYSSLSVNKTSDDNLFIVWLIEYQGVPYYLLIFIPTFMSSIIMIPYAIGTSGGSTSFNIYGYNGNCNLACNGNCPSANISGYIVTVQNGNPILQIPATIPVGNAVSSEQVLVCSTVTYYVHNPNSNVASTYNISSSYSTDVALSPSGGTFYVFFLTLTITYQVS
jgi:hypothetical protein